MTIDNTPKTIYINSKSFVVSKEKITYEEILQLLHKKVIPGYTITYSKSIGSGLKYRGTLIIGQHCLVLHRLYITCVMCGNA